jgi:hypothetical protein
MSSKERGAAIAVMKATPGGTKEQRSHVFQGLLAGGFGADQSRVYHFLLDVGLPERHAWAGSDAWMVGYEAPPSRRASTRKASTRKASTRKASTRNTRKASAREALDDTVLVPPGVSAADWRKARGYVKAGTSKRVEQILRAEGVPAPLARSLAGAAVEYADASSQAPARAARWAWRKATRSR